MTMTPTTARRRKIFSGERQQHDRQLDYSFWGEALHRLGQRPGIGRAQNIGQEEPNSPPSQPLPGRSQSPQPLLRSEIVVCSPHLHQASPTTTSIWRSKHQHERNLVILVLLTRLPWVLLEGGGIDDSRDQDDNKTIQVAPKRSGGRKASWIDSWIDWTVRLVQPPPTPPDDLARPPHSQQHQQQRLLHSLYVSLLAQMVYFQEQQSPPEQPSPSLRLSHEETVSSSSAAGRPLRLDEALDRWVQDGLLVAWDKGGLTNSNEKVAMGGPYKQKNAAMNSTLDIDNSSHDGLLDPVDLDVARALLSHVLYRLQWRRYDEDDHQAATARKALAMDCWRALVQCIFSSLEVAASIKTTRIDPQATTEAVAATSTSSGALSGDSTFEQQRHLHLMTQTLLALIQQQRQQLQPQQDGDGSGARPSSHPGTNEAMSAAPSVNQEAFLRQFHREMAQGVWLYYYHVGQKYLAESCSTPLFNDDQEQMFAGWIMLVEAWFSRQRGLDFDRANRRNRKRQDSERRGEVVDAIWMEVTDIRREWAVMLMMCIQQLVMLNSTTTPGHHAKWMETLSWAVHRQAWAEMLLAGMVTVAPSTIQGGEFDPSSFDFTRADIRSTSWITMASLLDALGWNWLGISSSGDHKKQPQRLGEAAVLCTVARLAIGEIKIQLEAFFSSVSSDTMLAPADDRTTVLSPPSTSAFSRDIFSACAHVLVLAVQYVAQSSEGMDWENCDDTDSNDGSTANHVKAIVLSPQAVLHLRHSFVETWQVSIQYWNLPSLDGPRSLVLNPIMIELMSVLLTELDIFTLSQDRAVSDDSVRGAIDGVGNAVRASRSMELQESLLPALTTLLASAEGDLDRIGLLRECDGFPPSLLVEFLAIYFRACSLLEPSNLKKRMTGMEWACQLMELFLSLYPSACMPSKDLVTLLVKSIKSLKESTLETEHFYLKEISSALRAVLSFFENTPSREIAAA